MLKTKVPGVVLWAAAVWARLLEQPQGKSCIWDNILSFAESKECSFSRKNNTASRILKPNVILLKSEEKKYHHHTMYFVSCNRTVIWSPMSKQCDHLFVEIFSYLRNENLWGRKCVLILLYRSLKTILDTPVVHISFYAEWCLAKIPDSLGQVNSLQSALLLMLTFFPCCAHLSIP